jgi:hypothetical protein
MNKFEKIETEIYNCTLSPTHDMVRTSVDYVTWKNVEDFLWQDVFTTIVWDVSENIIATNLYGITENE